MREKMRYHQDNGMHYPDWNEKELIECVVEYVEKTVVNNQYPVLSSTASGIYLQSEYFTKQTASDNTTGYKVVPYGYFTYRSMSDTGRFTFNIQRLVDMGIVSPAYPVFSAENMDADYLYYVLNHSGVIKEQLAMLREGGTRLALPFSSLKRLKVTYPDIEEQKKIAETINAATNNVRVAEIELKKLIAAKMSLMNGVFNRKVHLTDDEGKEYPAWEHVKIRDVAECLDRMRVPLNAETRATMEGDIPYYGAGNIQGYINQYLFDEELVLLLEDGDAFDDYQTKTIAQYVIGKSWVNNHAHILRPKQNGYFLYCALAHKDIRKWTQLAGQSRKKLVQDAMLDIELDMPCIEEQKKIAELFKTLNDQIEIQTKYLNKMKDLREALLQKLI